MDQPNPYVVIDIKAVYDQLLVLSTRVELLMSRQLEHDKVDADHESRLRSLEKARWPLPSVAILLSLGSAAVALFRH